MTSSRTQASAVGIRATEQPNQARVSQSSCTPARRLALLTPRLRSYLQGMNYLAAFFLVVAGEEESAFWLLAARKQTPRVKLTRTNSHVIPHRVSRGGYFLRVLLSPPACVPARCLHPPTGGISLELAIGFRCKVFAKYN